MILNLIRYGFTAEAVMGVLASIFVVFCTLPVHEYAHALVATKLGDPTPRLKGRLTLNPIAHIDIIGGLMILLVGFGYAKPVPINIRNFKNRKLGMALTAAAGPLSNLIMALIFLLLKNVIAVINAESIVAMVSYYFFYYAAYINISLAVFNLIPIPPLDGSRIINIVVPDKYYYMLMKYERYIMIGVLILLWTGLLTTPLSWLSGKVFDGISAIAAFPFNLFLSTMQ